MKTMACACKQLVKYFKADTKVLNITATAIAKYAIARREQGAKNGTVNRETAMLVHSLSLPGARSIIG